MALAKTRSLHWVIPQSAVQDEVVPLAAAVLSVPEDSLALKGRLLESPLLCEVVHVRSRLEPLDQRRLEQVVREGFLRGGARSVGR